MKIENYKKTKNGKYKVSFSNGKTIDLYEEVILKYELLLKTEITSKIILDVTSNNEECEVYYQALKMIKTKSRTIKETEDTLIKKEYPLPFIKLAITKLVSQKYLDDEFYSKAYTNQGINSSKGPYKIMNELEKKGVSKELISNALNDYTDELQLQIVTKKIKKMIESNHTKSNLILQKKIMTDLINQGFSKEIILSVLNDQEMKDDSDIIKKEYQKLYNKLSKKYEGKELEYKIKQKMYQKGMSYDI